MQSLSVTTPQELSALLTQYNVDVSRYGQGTAKTLAQLLKELLEGECSLAVLDGSLTRSVHVLMVALTREDGKRLTETNQTFHATPERAEYSRQRNCLLAEKILPEEDITTATCRAIQEELGVAVKGNIIASQSTDTEQKPSQSYPGLRCLYRTVRVTVLEKSLERQIPDGYTFTEYFTNGQLRVTATWHWL